MKKGTLPSSVITVKLTGASHLVGFGTFSLQQVRRVSRRARPGARFLAGPFHSQPPMNEDTPIVLKPPARCLLVAGRAFCRDHDLFVPLVPAPGEETRIVLPAPPRAPVGLLDRLAELFKAARWIWATSYERSAPHFYSRRSDWPDDDDFVWCIEQVQKYGYRNRFGLSGHAASWWQQLDAHDGYVYWAGYQLPQQTPWVNRRRLRRAPVPIDLRQELIVRDGRVLEVPSGPDPWQELAAVLGLVEGQP
jgi:hypothetical protein